MNREIQIRSISLPDLKKLVGLDLAKQPSECLIVHSESSLDALHFPCRIDALIIGVCTEGEASSASNLQEFTLRKDSLFIYVPNNIIHTTSSQSFKAQVMVITSEFIRRMNLDTTRMMPLFIQFATTPCAQLAEQEAGALCRLIAQLQEEVAISETPYGQEVISGLVSTIIYKAGNILQQHLAQEATEQRTSKSRAESYFMKFMQMLSENYKTERSVGYYAKQLCITPKYLTTVIRRISGKSVSEWVDNCVILEAKTLLKYSDMSIQEIAYYLNFPNQSFFGSYFKRSTGLSPSQYKAQ